MLVAPKKNRPALRYYGGKWMLAKWIISLMPTHRVYVEPFGGAASVLLQKPRSYAEVYNDLCGDVVNLFRVLRDPEQTATLKTLLENTPFAREEFFAAYAPSNIPVERARRIIIRSFMGFGSASSNINYRTGFRSNSNRSGTTPAHDWANYPKNLAFLTDRMRGVCVESKNALDVIAQHDGPNTFFYVDPPYLHETRNSSRQSYAFELTDIDHEQLAACLHCIQGKALVSGYHSPLYDRLYAGWHIAQRKAFADGASKRTEVVWANYELPETDSE